MTWVNEGPSSHSATADDGSFDTGVFPEGESRSVTFEDVGTFTYICTPHPDMEGTVIVEAAGSLTRPTRTWRAPRTISSPRRRSWTTPRACRTPAGTPGWSASPVC